MKTLKINEKENLIIVNNSELETILTALLHRCLTFNAENGFFPPKTKDLYNKLKTSKVLEEPF